MTILRTPRNGCWTLVSNNWGQYLAPASDPDADTIITDEQLEGFELSSNINKIPADVWNAWINLCIEMVKRGTGDLEVSCRIVRCDDQYRIFIPVQKVTGVSVRVDSFDKAADIMTGEVVEQWPPAGWSPCGSSHSHNTMDSFFSGTDDQYELGDPGIHIVVGNIDDKTGSYTLAASVTANMRRFLVEPSDLVHLDPTVETAYHPSVLSLIDTGPTRIRATLPVVQPYTPAVPQKKTDPAIDHALQDVRAALLDLKMLCSRLQISPSDALITLVDEIEDDVWKSDNLSNDPFYWNTYYDAY